MDIGAYAEKLMFMDERAWAKHANPWSGWTRVATFPLLTLTIWKSRVDRMVVARPDPGRHRLGLDQSAPVPCAHKHRQLDVARRVGRTHLASAP